MLVTLGLHGANWPQFRGPGGNCIAVGESIPLEFGPDKHVAWRVELPIGHSSPCVWGDRIFLTGHVGTTLKMLSLRRSDGKVLWERERILPKQSVYEHVAGDPANPTPATDGSRVVFYFDDYGMIATDFEGAVQWERKLPSTGNSYSYGASPVIDEGRVYLNRDGGLDPSLMCLKLSDGSDLWKAARPKTIECFCTPYLVPGGTSKLVLAGGTGALTAYNAASGQETWQVTGLPIFICPSAVAEEGMVVFGGWTTAHVTGKSRIESVFEKDSGVSEAAMNSPAAFFAQFDANKDGKLTPEEFPPSRARDAFNFIDKNKDGFVDMAEWAPGYEDKGGAPGRNVMLGIATGGRGDITATHVRWELTKGLPYVASPVAYRGRVYLVATGGFVTCVDTKTGRPFFEKERLGVGGEYYATPVAIGDSLLICSHRGPTFLIKAGDRFEILSKTDLGEPIFATPAVANRTLYLRSERHLWAFSER